MVARGRRGPRPSPPQRRHANLTREKAYSPSTLVPRHGHCRPSTDPPRTPPSWPSSRLCASWQLDPAWRELRRRAEISPWGAAASRKGSPTRRRVGGWLSYDVFGMRAFGRLRDCFPSHRQRGPWFCNAQECRRQRGKQGSTGVFIMAERISAQCSRMQADLALAVVLTSLRLLT